MDLLKRQLKSLKKFIKNADRRVLTGACLAVVAILIKYYLGQVYGDLEVEDVPYISPFPF